MIKYELLAMGRSSIDLESRDIGAPFPLIQSFSASLGGSPARVCVGAQRLGLRTVLLTAVGEDPVGDYIIHSLHQEGVETRFISEKSAHRSGAVLRGIQLPDRFPEVRYLDHCADVQLDIDDVLAAPLSDCHTFLMAGSNLSQEPCRSATLVAAETARQNGSIIVLDVDYCPAAWHDARAFGVSIRSAFRLVDVVIATPEELRASLLMGQDRMFLSHSQESDIRAGDRLRAIKTILGMGPQALILKLGAEGCEVHLKGGRVIGVAGFPVDVKHPRGAGDAFAAGLIFSLVRGWEWQRAARLGNACGALLLTQEFLPTWSEVQSFMQRHGLVKA